MLTEAGSVFKCEQLFMGKQWFIHDGSQQRGPLSEATISEMASNGMLNDGTLLWTEGMADWIPFSKSPFCPKSSQPEPPPVPQRPCSQPSAYRQIIAGAEPNTVEIKKTPVILTIIFTVITAGIYYPAWFLTRRQAINSLLSKEKIGTGVFVFGIVVYSLSLLLMMTSGFFEGLSEATNDLEFLGISKAIEALDNILSLVIAITLLVQCYKVRRILRDHFNERLGQNIYWSGVMIFFFQIFYLQYKVNRLDYNVTGPSSIPWHGTWEQPMPIVPPHPSEAHSQPVAAVPVKRRMHSCLLAILIALGLLVVGLPLGLYIGGKAFMHYAKRSVEKTPLYLAVAANNIEEADRLLAEGANPGEKAMMGHSPLIMAARCDYSLIAERLLKAGADPNQKDNLQWAPLHHAIKTDNANLDMISILVRHGADVNVTDSHLRTPLHRAAQFGHVEVVRLLLRLGADPNAKDKNGWTPLDRGAAHPAVRQAPGKQ